MLAILNGVMRERVLIEAFGNVSGLFMSGIILSICIFLVALISAPWFGPLGSRQWLLVGMLWFIFTVVFEFGFGRFAQDKAWGELFDAYTFRGGNIWPVVLLVTLLSPWLAARIRNLI
ncbi:MAG: hypothetical protein PVH05_15000 [Burkholderiales bacterium]